MGSKKINACDLQQYLEECVFEAIDKIAKESIQTLTAYIMHTWYDQYTPKDYRRTYQFIESLSKTEVDIDPKGYIRCNIFYDTSKIHPIIRDGELNAHASFSGENVSENIPMWIENGHDFLGRGYEEGMGAMEKYARYLEDRFPGKIAEELKKQGLQVKVTG